MQSEFLSADYQKREVQSNAPSVPQDEDNGVYFLIEEREDDDLPRNMDVLAVSKDRDGLRKLMQAKIEKDEYGYIAENGISDESEDHFCTNYEGGFVQYSISKHLVLSKEDIEQLLRTSEYDPVYHPPENLREILVSVINTYAQENGYLGIDAHPVADALLSDKLFHAFLINEYWSSDAVIPERSLQFVRGECTYYLSHLLKENPDYFVETGGLTPISVPDNLSDILFDSIYAVARDHRLPLKDPEGFIYRALLDPAFQSVCRSTFQGVPHLVVGSDLHQSALRRCYEYVSDRMLPIRVRQEHPSITEQIKLADAKKQEQMSSPSSSVHQQKDPDKQEEAQTPEM